jgi:hypothetical protein
MAQIGQPQRIRRIERPSIPDTTPAPAQPATEPAPAKEPVPA